MDWARTTTHTHTHKRRKCRFDGTDTNRCPEWKITVELCAHFAGFENIWMLIINHMSHKIPYLFFVLLRITKSSLCRNLLSCFLRVPQLAHSVAVMRSLNALQSNALASFFINGTYFFLYSHSICNFWNLKTMLICIASKIHTTIENVRWIDANPTHQVWRKREKKNTVYISGDEAIAIILKLTNFLFGVLEHCRCRCQNPYITHISGFLF